MTERELLIDCLQRLNRTRIEYLLTGSMASNYWGIPRTTHDLDFVVHLSPSAVERLVAEFSGEFYIDVDAVRASFQPPFQFNAIDQRSALKVDFWLLQTAPFDRELFSRRVDTLLFGEQAWIASAEDVILHKLLWNRMTPSQRQIGDAIGVIAVQGDRLDTAYLRRWAAALEVSEVLEELLRGKVGPKAT